MDGYTVLGLSPGATERQVRAAYHRLARLNHPDRQPIAWRASAERRMQEVNEARESVLREIRQDADTSPCSAADPVREAQRFEAQRSEAQRFEAQRFEAQRPAEQRRLAAVWAYDAERRRERRLRDQLVRSQRLERLRREAEQAARVRAERRAAPEPLATALGRMLLGDLAHLVASLLLVSTLTVGILVGLGLGLAVLGGVELLGAGHGWVHAAGPVAFAVTALTTFVVFLGAGWDTLRSLWS